VRQRHQRLTDVAHGQNAQAFAQRLGAATTVPGRHHAGNVVLPLAQRQGDVSVAAASPQHDDAFHASDFRACPRQQCFADSMRTQWHRFPPFFVVTLPVTIELTKEARQQLILSIERYFLDSSGEKIGNLAAAALLGFFLDELGPVVYNKAVADAQQRLQYRVAELDMEVYQEEFQYWRKKETKSRR